MTEITTALIQKLLEFVLVSGAEKASVIASATIPYHPVFRDACAQNSCGKYGHCWMCPPDVGDIDHLIASAKKYTHAIVFQTVGTLEDSFDIEGMEAAARYHNQVCSRFFEYCRSIITDFLPLGAGGCHLCATCTRLSDEPCRFPQKAFSSLEAYGIGVADLAELCDMKYLNGINTVTYFGALLLGRKGFTQ